jgi:hypothetical protein
MMSGMLLETCRAFNKRWNNKFYYKVASCWLFLLIRKEVQSCENQRPQIQLELLMMSGMLLETCRAFNKRWNNKLYYKVASCWLFLLIRKEVQSCDVWGTLLMFSSNWQF